jgi:uncharacterized protein (TIGR02145 family)
MAVIKMKTIAMLMLFCAVAFAQQKGTFTDPRDGKTYKTVKIGVQTWMAENLKYAPYGECYDNDMDYCKKYGRLYYWVAAMEVCPSGWHLPGDDEWAILVDFVGGDKVAGKKLKAKSGWNSGGNGDDAFGFSALPGGIGTFSGIFYDVGDFGVWWGATEINAASAIYRGMAYRSASVGSLYIDKTDLRSVRCVRD